ncbi:MAG: chorismate synthase [Brevinematales bacterium]|nr:chorismate synthase [Brevinematales bacterium]
MIKYFTSGESHGRGISVIAYGFPSNIPIDVDYINNELSRRQKGYGRGGRMKIEKDTVDIIGGVRNGKTIGSPISMVVWNKDWENWKDKNPPKVTKPRPGHADLIGVLKYGFDDIRDVLERASARETSARVCVGALAKYTLEKFFDVRIFSHVVVFGGIKVDLNGLTYKDIIENSLLSDVGIGNPEFENEIKSYIDKVKSEGDTIGGIIEIVVLNPPIGLGSYTHWEDKIDARIAYAVMSIQAIKGVEFGMGFKMGMVSGSQVHDEISWNGRRFVRYSNNAGGIEGGMTNGEPIILRAVMKPISTLMKPKKSVDMVTKEEFLAHVERSDVTAVPSAGVVIESVVAIELLNALLKRYGGDDIRLIKNSFESDDIQKHRTGLEVLESSYHSCYFDA